MLAVLIGLIIFFLIIRRSPAKIKSSVSSHDNEQAEPVKILLFSLVWLFLPLGVYIWAQIINPRYMYISVIPFSIILSVYISEGYRWIIKRLKSRTLYSSDSSFILSFIHIKTVGFILVCGIAFFLFRNSPLLKRNTEWENMGAMSRMFFHEIAKIIPEIPKGAKINIYGLPTQAYLRQHSITSWFNLKYPENQYQVVLKSMLKIYSDPHKLSLKVKKRGNMDFALFCRIKKNKKQDHYPERRSKNMFSISGIKSINMLNTGFPGGTSARRKSNIFHQCKVAMMIKI
jgi:hypothetical protein